MSYNIFISPYHSSMFSLKPHSTFHIESLAKHIITIENCEDIGQMIESDIFQNNRNRLIIWWGSNIVFTQNFDGIIILNKLRWKTIKKELNNSVVIALASGENWNDTVQRTVEQWYAGLENLIAIPGTVWAAPVQNIWAYWSEAGDHIIEVKWLDLSTWQEIVYNNEGCKFGYRDSIFKHTLKQDFFITEVIIQLTKANSQTYHPKINYQWVEEELLQQWRDGWSYLAPFQVAHAIKNVRESKLPDRKKIGTCGSFFANPIITAERYEVLKKEFSNLVWHTVWTDKIKLSAWQLIELCGLKWYRDWDAGIYEKHALVLVNYGNATGVQIKGLISMIQIKVKETFWIEIVPEVNVY